MTRECRNLCRKHSIAFGRPFISNPDLVERFRDGWTLAADAPMSDWYLHTSEKGYTDFPVHQ